MALAFVKGFTKICILLMSQTLFIGMEFGFCWCNVTGPNTSPSLNGMESFVQILQHFTVIFHLMGSYGGGGGNFKCL